MFKQLKNMHTNVHAAFLHYNYSHRSSAIPLSGCFITKQMRYDLSINHVSPSVSRCDSHHSTVNDAILYFLDIWMCAMVKSSLRGCRWAAVSYKTSEYIQLLSLCEWMHGCMWMGRPHTMQGRWGKWFILSGAQWQGVSSDNEDGRWNFCT